MDIGAYPGASKSFWGTKFQENVLLPLARALQVLKFAARQQHTRTTYWRVARNSSDGEPDFVELEKREGALLYDAWIEVGPRSSDVANHHIRPPPVHSSLVLKIGVRSTSVPLASCILS